MGKIAIWILIIIAVMLVLRLIAVKKRPVDEDGKEAGTTRRRRGSKDDIEPRGNAGELMMSCAVCGIHLPSSEAVFAHGKVFCGPEHRDVEEARRGEG
jgi:uncharacterized protein